MEIWHTKEEKPEVATGFVEASLLIKRDNSYGVWYQIIAFYEFEKYKNVIIEWCKIADLLSLEQQLQAKDKEIERLTEIFELWLQGHQKDWEKLVKEGNRAKMSAFLSKNNQNSIDNLLSKLKEFGYKDNVKSNIIKDYEEGLKEISRQKTLEEMKDNPDYMDEDGDFIGDFEFAYDELVKVARQALENNLEKHKEQ